MPSPTMPIDKQKNGTPAKPFTPTLSTALRNPRSPLTPRLADPKTASPLSPPRRGLRTDPAAPSTTRREDFRSPTTAKLSGNITPRSGARSARKDGESPSVPASARIRTPSRTRPFSAVELSKPGGYNGIGTGLGICSPESRTGAFATAAEIATGRVVSGGSRRRVSTGSPRNAAIEATAASPFHASDAQRSLSPEVDDVLKSGGTDNFFHAHGTAPIDGSGASPPTPEEYLEREERAKFFYANESAAAGSSTSRKNRAAAFRAGSPAISSPRYQPLTAERLPKTQQKPHSPAKAASVRSAPATSHPSRNKAAGPSIRDGGTRPKTPIKPATMPRRTSLGSKNSIIKQPAQQKTSNTTSAPSTPSKKKDLHISPVTANPHQALLSSPVILPLSPITSHLPPRSASLSSSSNTALSTTQTPNSTPSTSLHPLGSPTKSDNNNTLQRTNELAANARRERKVLDLEISNSSLLAINRTLEREMRKQSVELRRFRRLSRSGRLSLASGASVRSVSGHSNALVESEDGDGEGIQHARLSDLDEEEEEWMSNSEADEETEDDLESSFEDGESVILSPKSRAEHDVRQGARDDRRLMLDLSKHRQLLVDSQKVDGSIKRCLGWTEELIREGLRALEYTVKVNDVELGGKVLLGDLEDGDEGDGDGGGSEQGGKGLLSPIWPVADILEVESGQHTGESILDGSELEVQRLLGGSPE